MPGEPVLLKRIPIAEVGKWSASTGEWEATRAKFDAAVRASQDRTLRQGRVFLGHNEQRTKTGMDTVPAVGLLVGLSHENDVLYADHLVPPGIAATAELHWPSRSLEATEGVTAPSGETYEMHVTGVAWLGDELPAVDTLPDLAQLWGMDAAEFAVAASAAETSGSRLIVCALKGDTATSTSTVEPVNQRTEGTMPNDATDTTATAETSTTAAVETTSTTTGAEAEATDTSTTTDATTAVTDTQDTTSSGLVIPEGFTLVEKAKYDELTESVGTLTATVKTLTDAKLEDDADEFAKELVGVGKIAASSKGKFAAQFKKNPDGTRALCDLLPEGTHEPPPLGRVAATRANDSDESGAFDENGQLKPEYRVRTPQSVARQAQS